MYDVIYINIGKSRANLVCVFIKIKIFIFYKTKVKTLKLNRE
jgi:hypothetical protein